MRPSLQKALQKGLSLVELMISLTVGSIITAGVVQLFSANSGTYGVMMGQSRMQESARFALDFIGRDLYKVGYLGCLSNNEQLYWTSANPDDIPYEFDLRFGLAGHDASGVDLWSPVLDELPSTIGTANTNVFIDGTGINTDNIVSGTDILTVRNVLQQDIEIRLAARMGSSREDIRVVAPPDGLAGLGFSQWDLAMIHDCEKATIFHVTALALDAAPDPDEIVIEHSLDPTDAWRNSFETLAIKNTFEEDASVSAIETHIYFIAPGLGENSSGDAPLSLWRKSGTTAPVELVEGIENLQILYGVSTDGNLTPNRYRRANEVDMKEVITVRVTVIANTIDDVGGTRAPTLGCGIQNCAYTLDGGVLTEYDGDPANPNGTDGLMRRAFTQTFMLRNRS
ncbi:MAG: PilW family protein [Proteobacteria bacterium]|nr:PilW family protein [Pseudomonadota bacterium]